MAVVELMGAVTVIE
jgi:hypothetical protein